MMGSLPHRVVTKISVPVQSDLFCTREAVFDGNLSAFYSLAKKRWSDRVFVFLCTFSVCNFRVRQHFLWAFGSTLLKLLVGKWKPGPQISSRSCSTDALKWILSLQPKLHYRKDISAKKGLFFYVCILMKLVYIHWAVKLFQITKSLAGLYTFRQINFQSYSSFLKEFYRTLVWKLSSFWVPFTQTKYVNAS